MPPSLAPRQEDAVQLIRGAIADLTPDVGTRLGAQGLSAQ